MPLISRVALKRYCDEYLLYPGVASTATVGLHRVPCVTRCDRGCLMFTGLY